MMKDRPVILVVDDQPQNVELLEAFLVPQGYEIVRASNGEEALEKLSGNDIDLILLDVMMPGIDGFEVTRRVRQDKTHRQLPIVLVTGLRETEDRVKGIEAGCDDFLSKPINMLELLSRVRSLLKVRAYNDLLSNYQQDLESEVTARTGELNHAMENLRLEIIERKMAEEELGWKTAFLEAQTEATSDGILVVDSKANVTMTNQHFLDMMRVPQPMRDGKDDTTLLHYVTSKTMYPERFMEKVKYLYDHPKETSRDEIEFKDGTVLDRYSSPVVGKDGKYYGRIWFFRDITEHKQADARVKKALGATIQAIAVTVETRDPYTAGHQRRVADLARAIATEMNLSLDMIDGIHMSTVIHDLGKISVPAEILSKPTKLTELEFSLIKTHSQSGHDILKDIEFPWPVARIILEHHERMNGSGYPSGLSGDSILMESRILAVADVIESMASHRPYRPALGLDAALKEIEKNRGTFYDNTVVDSCLRLFQEKGFQLKEA